MTVEKLFDELWKQYVSITPQAQEIKDLFLKTQKNDIINDHIALRTLGFNECKIEVLAKNFTDLGYVKQETYDFKSKKLKAHYYSHNNPKYAKVFISELKVYEFDKKIQDFLKTIIDRIPVNTLNSNTLVTSGRHWEVSYEKYKELYSISEYLAWFYVYGFRANHFTVYINDLENFNNIEDVNNFLKKNSYELNTTGGEIKGDSYVCLEQSSTLAEKTNIDFIDGTYSIPSCFYEFAKRYKDSSNKIYDGFVVASADKIFESTNQR
ncbi:MAG: succinyldiaminopimelate aminotransferase [Arcobacter sp.]|nr:MAG: succinyldiaminopimelate aminotransferase [Arcobacter sp.]